MCPYSNTTTDHLLSRNARDNPDGTAIIYAEQNISFSRLDAAASAFASGLIKLGLRKGDKVGLWMQNFPGWAVAWFGISRAGGVVIPLDYWYKASEAEYILGHSDALLCITADSFGKVKFLEMLGEIRPNLPALKHIISVANTSDGNYADPSIHSFRSILHLGEMWQEDVKLALRQEGNRAEDIAFILYTSGTTGKPKGAQLTHRNTCMNTYGAAQILGLTTDDNILVPVPFSHSFGCVLGITVASVAGCAVTPMLRFDPRNALAMIQKYKITVMHGVPTMFIRMLEVLEHEEFSSETLRTGIMAGAPCPVDTMQGVISDMGCNIGIAYGLTEASPIITMTRHDDSFIKRVATVGRPIPDVEVRIVDENNNSLPVGEMGEICCRGYNVFAGYYKDPGKTTETIDPEGWLHTGDLAVEDEDGYYAIVGRKKDMVIVGGFNVYPRAIEEYLIAHDDIMNAAVIGVPDHDLGEVVFAVIEPEAGAKITAQDVVDYCYGKMASAKVPRYVSLDGNIPISGRGKVLKYKMREELTERIKKDEFEKLTPSAVKKEK